MAKRVGRYVVQTENNPVIAGYGSAVGKKEKEGPLGSLFDVSFDDDTVGQESFEQAESAILCNAIVQSLKKSGTKNDEVDVIFAGDLLSQSMSSTFGLKKFRIPTVGLFGACSTMALSLSQAALAVDSGWANIAVAATGSHFCSAERQFRFPLEYGGRRTPNSQWTVTGAGAMTVKSVGENMPYIHAVCIGKIADYGITDANNMGAAMAPAAADTIKNYLDDTHTSPDDYDLIITGDLGDVGSKLLKELLSLDGIKLSHNYDDCGLMIFDPNDSSIGAGGSGCGCSGSVMCAKILPEIKSRKYKNVLFVATGALMSLTSSQQGLSIPAVAHAVEIRI